MSDASPGPWEYEATDVRSPYPFVVKAGNLVIARITDEGDAGVPEANARRIAGVLELLEASETTLGYLRTILPVSMSNSVCITLLEDAIAKATGGE